MYEYRNIKTFWKSLHSQLVWRNFYDLKKKKENIVPWTYFVSDLNGEKIAKNLLPKKKKSIKTSLKDFSVKSS